MGKKSRRHCDRNHPTGFIEKQVKGNELCYPRVFWKDPSLPPSVEVLFNGLPVPESAIIQRGAEIYLNVPQWNQEQLIKIAKQSLMGRSKLKFLMSDYWINTREFMSSWGRQMDPGIEEELSTDLELELGGDFLKW